MVEATRTLSSGPSSTVPIQTFCHSGRMRFMAAASSRAGGAVRFQSAESLVGRGVVLAGVIADHAVGVYEWAKRADRRLHALNPGRNAVGPAIVEGGNDIALQQIVERLGFYLVLVLTIGIIFALADGPAHLPRILRVVPHLVPPAVGHA